MNKRSDQADVSINIFEQIDEICEEFRQTWKQGNRVEIANYMSRVGENAQPMLFRNLLATEVKYQIRSGNTPKSSDYLKRFPQFAKIIRQEFDESTMGSMEINVGTPQESAGSAERGCQ